MNGGGKITFFSKVFHFSVSISFRQESNSNHTARIVPSDSKKRGAWRKETVIERDFFFIFRWLYTLGRYCSYPLLLYFFFICFLSFTNLSLFFLQIFVFDLVVIQTAKGSFSFYFFVLIF